MVNQVEKNDNFYKSEIIKSVKKYEDWIFDPKSFDKTITANREEFVNEILDLFKMFASANQGNTEVNNN